MRIVGLDALPLCMTVISGGVLQVANIRKNNDYAMWLRVSHRADCYLLNKTLAKYRKRSGSISNHSYHKLILWHYKLFREAEQKNVFSAIMLTGQNLLFGCMKKIIYVKRDNL